MPYEHTRLVHTVQGLFGEIRRAAALHAHDIQVEYAASGYPRRVYIDWHANIADEEIEYVVTSLAPQS